MKRSWAVALGMMMALPLARAQSTLDALQQELNEVTQQHHDATAQNLSNFFSQVDQAMASPEAALALYQQAGGAMPASVPVTTVHETESATEKDARLAQDAANAATLGGLLQLHCGLLHYAALFVAKPDQKGLRDDFLAWLQKAAQSYPKIVGGSLVTGGGGGGGGGNPGGQHHRRLGGGGGGAPFNLNEIKGKTMKDSIISKFLGFKSWGDKEQGGWSVREIPKLYRTDILEPLRATPSLATLAAWDVVIAMANADETDNDRWTSTVYPPLQFDRACDDYAISPATEKLQGILQLIHANPTHPAADDWLTRAGKLIDDYRAKHGGAPPAGAAPAAAAPPTNSNPNVTVTTEQQGDATVITTHTNAAPVAPAH